MNYKSTRGLVGSKDQPICSSEAVITGIALDGGLFVPEKIPRVSDDFIADLVGASYIEQAQNILSLFLTDYDMREITSCLERAYEGKFDDEAIAPVKCVGEKNVLELWHGPTSAFKDMALQLLPQLLTAALKNTGEKDEILILVATSGDTGKAALAGFADVPQTKICVFYPDGGISDIQRLQMATQAGKNVAVIAVCGNFDDAQTGVKNIFADKTVSEKLATSNVRLSSANSINWGRLVPQIVYYFSAYADLIKKGRIKIGEAVDFTVPTGNFGNILAGYYAKEMGLPIGSLVCASNANDVLTEFLLTGRYDKKRIFYKTISPSMDILVSSNLERLLYHLTADPAKVAAWMKELGEKGSYEVGTEILSRLKEIFWAGYADDAKTKETIKEVFSQYGYLLDPHTAVAWNVAEAYAAEKKSSRPMVIVSTASPYKFSASVLAALNGKDDEAATENAFRLLDRLAEKNTVPPPTGLTSLRNLPVLHTMVIEKEKMAEKVLAFAKG